MRKVISLLLGLILVFGLTGCRENIDIKDGVIDVQFENIHWEGSSIIVDVYVTNGTDEDYYMESMDFALFFPDEETEFCGAGFDILETIPKNDYRDYELEFQSDYVFFTQAQLDTEGITFDDLVLFFWYDGLE